MNKLVNFKDNGNTLISKQSVGIDVNNVIATITGSGAKTYIPNEDCVIYTEPTLTQTANLQFNIDGVYCDVINGYSTNQRTWLFVKKGQVLNWSGHEHWRLIFYGIKYL